MLSCTKAKRVDIGLNIKIFIRGYEGWWWCKLGDEMTDTPDGDAPTSKRSAAALPAAWPGKRALEDDARPDALGGRPKLTTSKILGVAHPHKPRIGPQYQAVVPPFRAPPVKSLERVQQGPAGPNTREH